MEVEKEWVPYSTAASLYIRPTLIGTEVWNIFSPLTFCVFKHEAEASIHKGKYAAVTRQQYYSSGANCFYAFTFELVTFSSTSQIYVDHTTT